jgi:hypothetical protein
VLSAPTSDNSRKSIQELSNWKANMALIQSTDTVGDLGINITSFKRHLLASNKSPKTVKTYLESLYAACSVRA